MNDERRDSHSRDPSPPADGAVEGPAAAEGVLGSLPRTRPQRVSPRRAASQAKRAQREKAEKAEEKPRTATARARPAKARRKASRPPAADASAPTAKPRSSPRPPAPKQGYEPEEDIELGRTVHPPGPAEVAESVLGIVVELASAGVKSTGRLLKDALSPLRRS